MKILPKRYNKNEQLIVNKKFLESAKSADFIFDIGANVGTITKQLLKQNGFVYAFEPDPEAFQYLKQIKSSNLVIQNVAVWTSDGEATLYRHWDWKKSKSHTSSTLISSKRNVDDVNTTEVVTFDISGLVKSLNGDIIMKIDVEGAEYNLLKYWSNTKLINCFSKIYCEFHAKKIRWGLIKHINLYILLRLRSQAHLVCEWY